VGRQSTPPGPGSGDFKSFERGDLEIPVGKSPRSFGLGRRISGIEDVIHRDLEDFRRDLVAGCGDFARDSEGFVAAQSPQRRQKARTKGASLFVSLLSE
jgi:hypothetical protein